MFIIITDEDSDDAEDDCVDDNGAAGSVFSNRMGFEYWVPLTENPILWIIQDDDDVDDGNDVSYIKGAVCVIVAKKWDPGILDPSRFSGQIRKVEARLGKLAKIRKVKTD